MADSAQSGLPPAIFLMGPTASGKTDLAAALVERLPLEIISVDSALVYRGMDIGTAKPSADFLARYPHRLIDLRDPSEPYSAAEFRDDALREMAAIRAGGRVPLLVGGTMLYFRALEYGLSRMPSADPALRAELEREAAALGWPALHARLARLDPEAGSRIGPADGQRIQRALELITLTGQPLAELYRQHSDQPMPWRLLKIALMPTDRAELHRRIALRMDRMLAEGFPEEMRTLFERGDLHPGLPSMRAVGYRQGWAWLSGEYDLATLRDKAIAATRQLARRQLTWLRSSEETQAFDPWLPGLIDAVAARVAAYIESS